EAVPRAGNENEGISYRVAYRLGGVRVPRLGKAIGGDRKEAGAPGERRPEFPGGSVAIGETLARQRQEAGLTCTQVSVRPRIRETVVRGIERDDFSLCGGNFYARGHVRSIARVIGIDPEPLVREFDDTHGGSPEALSAVTAFEPETPVRIRERRA